MKKRKKIHNKGFSIIETMVVMAILAILVSIAVPLYEGYVERVTQQVCLANCLQMERMYHAYLITENKEHTSYVFNEYLQKYENNLCPANGDIKYVHGTVRCDLHYKDEANGNGDDEEDGSVPFL